MSSDLITVASERVDGFVALLEASKARKFGPEAYWKAFRLVYPNRTGAEERPLLLALLETAEAARRIRLPSRRGRQWDRSMRPALPMHISLPAVRESRSAVDWASFAWHPQLRWVRELPRLTAEQEIGLRAIHDALAAGTLKDAVPLRYRSLQLTKDEKLLTRLMRTQLFGPGRLSRRVLNCVREVPPFAWERVGEGTVALVFENAGPFHVARAVFEAAADSPVGVLIYGGGNLFRRTVRYLAEVPTKITAVYYVGDLDWPGITIAAKAAGTAASRGLPEILPASSFHRAMFDSASALGGTPGFPDGTGARPDTNALAFLGAELGGRVGTMLKAGQRIPEEVLGPTDMRRALGTLKVPIQ
jgi:hypothetical protein